MEGQSQGSANGKAEAWRRLKTKFTWFGSEHGHWKLDASHSILVCHDVLWDRILSRHSQVSWCTLIFGAWPTSNVRNYRHRLWHLHFQALVWRSCCEVGQILLRSSPFNLQLVSSRKYQENSGTTKSTGYIQSRTTAIASTTTRDDSQDRRSRASWNKIIMACHTTLVDH